MDISNIPQLAILNVLLDGIVLLASRNLKLRVSPTRNFNDHVENVLARIGMKRNIVPGRDVVPIAL